MRRHPTPLLLVVCSFLGLPFAGCKADGSDETPESSDPTSGECAPAELPELSTETLASGDKLEDVILVKQSPDDDETFYVLHRKGFIYVYRDGSFRDEPFLDISDSVVHGYGEQGLLGLAFHPDYEENGRFFVDYTSSGDLKNVVAEYRRSEEDRFRAQPREIRRLVDQPDPAKQHNGGTLTFGPDDKYLFVSMGNGGGDLRNKNGVGNAQIVDNIFGTLLRLDVDRPEANYAAEDNPFVGQDGDDRIWHYGLRNPWKFSFDRATGDLWIGDVGRQDYEEIDFLPADAEAGKNFGWPAYEGSHDGPVGSAKEAVEEHTGPIYDYALRSQDVKLRNGCSIIGGYVYRGDAIPALRGYYVYGDLCSKDMAALRYCSPEGSGGKRKIVDHVRLTGLRSEGGRTGLRSISQDNDGELYIVEANKPKNKGNIARLVAAD